MTTRRQILQSAACLPGLWAMGPGRALAAGADPSRQALVIGNNSYRQAPLSNPGNDALAMAGLFEQAGLSVDLRLDATRAVMQAAIADFAAAIRTPKVSQAIFYYAGHGVQLDWRNYLLPVDVQITAEADIRERCIDLRELLGQLGSDAGKTYIIILDACRNNPFGKVFVPSSQGLSQFDAPPGSLLAYATAPGNVASDGSGKNGLYTENLVRELSDPEVRVEDALKRVRLNVRLASDGAQVPWETTSLESDVYLFPGARKKAQGAALEKELRRDLAAWDRVRKSSDPQDWINYLKAFPNGNFAEIAQYRITQFVPSQSDRTSTPSDPPRPAPQATVTAAAQPEPGDTAAAAAQPADELLPPVAAVPPALAPAPAVAEAAPAVPAEAAASVPDQPAAPAAPPASAAPSAPAAPPASATPSAPAAPSAPATHPGPAEDAGPAAAAIVIRPGDGLPHDWARSDNPYSQGRFPLGRVWTVGDVIEYHEGDALTGVRRELTTIRVTHVDLAANRVELNQGAFVFDLMGNVLQAPGRSFDTPIQFTPAFLQIGAKWRTLFAQKIGGRDAKASYEMRVAAREEVLVPAGRFFAFRIEGHGWADNGTRLAYRGWVVPGLNATVKTERIARNSSGSFVRSDRNELHSIYQQATGI